MLSLLMVEVLQRRLSPGEVFRGLIWFFVFYDFTSMLLLVHSGVLLKGEGFGAHILLFFLWLQYSFFN